MARPTGLPPVAKPAWIDDEAEYGWLCKACKNPTHYFLCSQCGCYTWSPHDTSPPQYQPWDEYKGKKTLRIVDLFNLPPGSPNWLVFFAEDVRKAALQDPDPMQNASGFGAFRRPDIFGFGATDAKEAASSGHYFRHVIHLIESICAWIQRIQPTAWGTGHNNWLTWPSNHSNDEKLIAKLSSFVVRWCTRDSFAAAIDLIITEGSRGDSIKLTAIETYMSMWIGVIHCFRVTFGRAITATQDARRRPEDNPAEARHRSEYMKIIGRIISESNPRWNATATWLQTIIRDHYREDMGQSAAMWGGQAVLKATRSHMIESIGNVVEDLNTSVANMGIPMPRVQPPQDEDMD